MSETSGWYTFRVTLHGRPPQVEAGPELALAGGAKWPTLSVLPTDLNVPLPVSFEEASDRLNALPQMFLEPDGSLVWTAPARQTRWQVDALLADRDGRMLFVDLKGYLPPERFDDLLRCFGWPEAEVIFQLSQEAVYLDEATFRRFAAQASQGG